VLRLAFFAKDVTLMTDVNLTIRTCLGLFMIWQISNFMSDAVFLWLVCNLLMTYPLVYQKKRAEVDRVVGAINLKIDEIISKIPLVNRLEKSHSEESKKLK
jgi:hypothetical protein